MSRWTSVVLVLLAAGLWLWGRSPSAPARFADSPNVVTFHTDPAHLEVWLWQADSAQPEFLGPVGEPLQLPRRLAQPARVQFGYQGTLLPGVSPFSEDYLRKQHFPADGEVKTVEMPAGLRARYIAEHQGAWLLGLVALLLAGAQVGVTVVKPRRQARRTEAQRTLLLESLQAAAEAQNDPLLGTRVGGWRLARPLGAGGMATVYLALPNESLDEREAVAVKVIHRQHASSEDFRERFRREVKVSSGLRHRNIMAVHDAGDENGLLYMAMEKVEGSTLREEVVEGGLPPRRILELVGPVMEALAYAHERGVIHRDLKPENIMLTPAGRVVVMDFGLARRQDFQTMTAEGSILGTPAYISPEQVGGKSNEPASDQYALGVMLYEFSTGVTPYGHLEDPIQVVLAHFTETPRPAVELRGDLPGAWNTAVMRMLAKAPVERFPSLREALRALEDAL